MINHSIILKRRHGHGRCVCAVNPSICAKDVSDSQTTRTSDGAPALRPQPLGQRGDGWMLSAVSPPPSWAGSRTEAVCVKCVCVNTARSSALCPRRTLRKAAAHAFRAETGACVGASVSSFPPFRKQKIAEEKTDPHRRVHPSVHASVRDRVSERAIVPRLQSGTESSVSKAASPSQQSNIGTVL